MADYIYLLQTRLTSAQQTALQHVREAARARAMTVFLVGGAVRDLTTGAPIRDLDIAVQGNALKLKRDLEKAGGTLLGEDEPGQALWFHFAGGVRLEVGSTLSATYPKPGKPVYKPANILDDLRRRDFTANAMALSLNDGSFGLLMDPLNGVADLENRELRLVSNYGFIEDPARMIRAVRFSARLGWQMEEKTRQRYENGKAEGYISALSPGRRGYELEEVFHEEDPLRVLRRLEAEGWARELSPLLASAKANEAELERLRDTAGQLEAMGIHPDPSAAYFPLLTAKLAPKDVATLKRSFAHPGFAQQIAALEADTKNFAALFTGKTAATPSSAWKMLFASEPEPILWLAHTTKSAPLQARFKAFFQDWSSARQKIPYQLMQEMRITPELPGYAELLDKLFFAIMDGQLETPESARAFLEPFSPPAPPPPVNLRRRAVKRETKPPRPRSKKASDAALEADLSGDAAAPAPASGTKPAAPAKPVAPGVKAVAAKPSKPAAAAPAKTAPVKAAAKPAAKPAPPPAASKKAAPAPRKATPPAKKAARPASKAAPARKAPAKKPAATSKVAAKKLPAKAAARQPQRSAPRVAPRPAKKPAKKADMPAKSAKQVAKKAARPAAKKPPVKAKAKPSKLSKDKKKDKKGKDQKKSKR